MSKRNVIRTACAVAAAAFLIACGAGTTPDGDPDATPANAPTIVTLPQNPEATGSVKPAPAKTTVATFGDGMWQVPEQVKPGTYKTVVPVDSWNCYYEVMKDFSGDIDSIITNGNQGASKQVIVSIPKTAKGIEVSGCGTWVKIK